MNAVKSADRNTLTPKMYILRNRILQFVVGTAGILVAVWPLFDLRFRNDELFLTSFAVLPAAVGIGMIIFAFLFPTDCRRAGFWFVLGLIGQAVCLQLINAGPNLRYQHYKPPSEILSGPYPIMAVFLAVQAITVLFGLIWQIKSKQTSTFNAIRPWQIVFVAVLFLVPTATVSEDVGFYVYEWILAGSLQTLQLGNAILFGLSLPKNPLSEIGKKLKQIAGISDVRFWKSTRFSRGLIIGLVIWVVFISAFLNLISYQNHPHVPDEVAYLIHARMLAGGELTAPAPPVPEAFETYLLAFKDGYMYWAPPPGWPLVLAIGSFFGLPWLVNPILTGLNLFLTRQVLTELYTRSTANIGILLLATSPWFIFLGMSFMTHMAALTCALTATLGVTYARRLGSGLWGWYAGFPLGFLALIRPLEALGMAALLGLWSLGLWGKRISVASFSGLVLGSMLVGSAGLIYNSALTGSALKFPINEYTDKYFAPNANAYGFGPDRGMGWAIDPNPGHGPIDALINSNLNVTQINAELFGWGIGSFLVIAVFFCVCRIQQSDYLMLTLIAIIYLLHFFYYFSGGPDFGARYWFLMILPLIALAARSIMASYEMLEKIGLGGERLVVGILALCLISVITFIPWRATDKYHHFRGMRPDVRHLIQSYGFKNSLVLIKGNEHPDFSSAVVYNSPGLIDSETIIAWDKDPETREKLLRTYKDRNIWVINGPSLTKRGFEVAEGPMSASSLLERNAR